MASKNGRQAIPFSTAIDEKIFERLHSQAAKEDRFVKAIIERALTEYFKRHK